MNFPKYAMTHRPIVYAAVAMILFAGISNFFTMSRREDPEIVIRSCLIMTQWPGAPSEKVDELVTDLIEKQVNQIDGIKDIISDSRVALSVIQVDLADEWPAGDIPQQWDEVRAKVNDIVAQLPDGCHKPWVNSDFGDVYSSCYAVFQRPPEGGWTPENERYRYSPRQLEIYCEQIEDEFLTLDDVSKVDFWGVQSERIYVEVDAADWAQLAFTPDQLGTLFDAQNIISPGGRIDTERSAFAFTPTGNFESVEEMRSLIIGRLGSVVPVRVDDVPLSIERRYEEPAVATARYATADTAGERCIIVGVAMKDRRNIVKMGDELTAKVAEMTGTAFPEDLAIELVNDTPRQVKVLVSDFVVNLLQAIIIVLAVAWLMMGWRPAVIMGTAVPLSMIAAIAVTTFFDVELEQFSIASLIIALGMVVDNAIVVSDNSMRLVAEGKPKMEAVIEGAQGLAIPILTSTATTICAFLPMVTIEGSAGEYIISLPIVVSCTLAASYFVAMLVTPIMCFFMLKTPEAGAEVQTDDAAGDGGRYGKMLYWCLDHKAIVIGGAVVAFIASLQLIPVIGSQFFPPGERDQVFIDIWLPEGASVEATEKVCSQVEDVLRKHSKGKDGEDRLSSVISFVGTGGPRILLTRNPEATFPYYAFMLCNTTDKKKSFEFLDDVRPELNKIPGCRIIAEPYMLGPPVDPVTFRITSDDPDVLREKAEEIVRLFKDVPGAYAVNNNWGTFGYQVTIDIDSHAANLAGATNEDVAFTMNTLLNGAYLTTFREGDHTVPVMLRTKRGSRNFADTKGIYITGRDGKVPLDNVAEMETTWQPANIARRNNRRTIEVSCRVHAGVLPNAIAGVLEPKIKAVVDSMPPGSFYEIGGELEKTKENGARVAAAGLISLFLIIFTLIVQYNSLLKPMIILFTLPLALIGVLIGLLLSGAALGFMPMLGVLSLCGIVINNAIVLIDFIEGQVAKGTALRVAVAQAGRIRMKPIVLTTLTTVGGLLPLGLFGGPLWEGMAYGMIAGLVLATCLTLFIVPTLYVLMAEKFGMKVG
ncbi:MAG: efflux RND transporter permease subunit [Planctomycetota bacterium]